VETNRSGHRWEVFLIAGLAVALYLPSIGGSFLNWDDEWLIVQNALLDEARDLVWILDPGTWRAPLGAEYLPVRDLTLWVDRQLWGLDPVGFHLTNVLLYGVVSALVLVLMRWWTRSRWAALAAAAVFVAHPVHVESVTWISERKGLLAAVFLLGALLAFHRWRASRRAPWFALALALHVLASLSKSTVHFFPLLLPVIGMIEARRRGVPVPVRRLALEAAPFLLISLGAMAVNAHHQGELGVAYGWEGVPLTVRVGVVGAAALRAFLHLLFPVGLCAVYELEAGTAGGAGFLLALGALALTGRAVWRGSRAAGPAAFALLAWLPVSNLVPLPNRAADRYLFLVSVGVIGLLGFLLARLLRSSGTERRTALLGLGAMTIALATLTVERQAVWSDPLLLWREAVERAPGSARAHQNLGEILQRRGRIAEAFPHYHRMLELEPERGEWWVFVAAKVEERGDRDEAIRLLREGIARDPDYGGTRVNLARRVAEEDPTEAERLLREIAEGDRFAASERGLAWLNLGVLQFRHGRLPDGIRSTRRALDFDVGPEHSITAYGNLARAYAQLGRGREARRWQAELRRHLKWLAPAMPK
jgi:tetratricopeptide (TPR) repeat protein